MGQRNDFQRSVLPIPDRQHVGLTTYDAKDPDTEYPPIEPVRPPAGAPNVVVIMLDDVGFGASSAFGGPCRTPTAERLAAAGLKYTRFHTTALCAATRQALLTGRNHHSVNMGAIGELATASPGYNSIRPRDKAPISQILKLNGYSTAQFGKCHEVPTWETSPVGPFDQWPTGGGGFEYFYGFVGGGASWYYPASLYEGTTPVEPDRLPEEGYHFTDDMTDKAIKWVRQQHALAPDRPFFVYFAPGATHAPHQVPREWADKYTRMFDQGWDALREETFARQKALGVIPTHAELTARPSEIPAWDSMPERLKPIMARQMETYAGFLEHTDYHVGRLVETLEEIGVFDNTLVFYILGDNGAAAESTPTGCFNEIGPCNGLPDLETLEYLESRLDQLGGPQSNGIYAIGWAHALDTPYQWTKQVAGHWGGTRVGTVVHWPEGVKARGEIRTQFSHVIDIAATILEVTDLPAPVMVNGITQAPLEGVSMAYSFEDGTVAERHDLQYFEIYGNRGVYHKGWIACTKHRTPWFMGPMKLPPFDGDVWELYGPDDDTQSQNIAKRYPAKLAELQRRFLIEASKYHVIPLDDRAAERFNPDLSGRPQLIRGTTQRLFGGMDQLSEGSVLVTKNKSHSITAEIVVPESGARGVIIAQGGNPGGWSLYVHEGRLKYCYNYFGIEHFYTEAESQLPSGTHQVRMEFTYDGGGLAKGGDVSLYLDGARVGVGRVERTIPMMFHDTDGCDVGRDRGSPVSPEYPARDNRFSGMVAWVQIDLGDDADGHLITPEDRFRAALAQH